MAKRILVGVFALSTLGTAISLIAETHDVIRSYAAQGWTPVDGVVSKSQVTPGCGINHQSFTPEIEYSYSHSGATHSGSRIAFDASECGSARWAQALVDKYPVGSQTTVHLDPADPERSTLMVGAVKTSTFVDLFLKLAASILFGLLTFELIKFLKEDPSHKQEKSSKDAKNRNDDMLGLSIFENE